MKKVMSLILSVMLLFGCFSVTSSAYQSSELVMGPTKKAKLHNAASSNQNQIAQNELSKYVDSVDDLFNYLKEEISKCVEEVDVLSFKIPCIEETYFALCNNILYGIPEIFNVYEIGISYYESGPDAGNIASLFFTYNEFADTATEYSTCMEKINLAADKLLKNIEGNERLSDEQKLLLLHDRLAIWNQFGYPAGATEMEAFTMYGALVNRTSVGQGYAMAYKYLLDRVGIESYYCSSDDLYHGWNIVYLNGESYHVDVTWDDIGWDKNANGTVGYVSHNYFLRSSDSIYNLGYEADDYDTTPTDTKYDNYFWQNSNTEFQLVGDKIYYLDNTAEAIKSYDENEEIISVKANWPNDAGNSWEGNFAALSSVGNILIYSQPKAIYAFNLKTNKLKEVFTPMIGDCESIYGFTYEDENIICDINNGPVGSAFDNKYRIIEFCEIECRHKNKCDAVKENEFAPTCVALGYYDIVVYCADCEEELSREEVVLSINPDNHKYDDYYDSDCNLCGYEREISILGDLDCSGIVNNKDLAILMRFLNGWDVEIYVAAADVYKDGMINNRDYALILQHVIGDIDLTSYIY